MNSELAHQELEAALATGGTDDRIEHIQNALDALEGPPVDDAWHLKEVIVQAVTTSDEDDGWFGTSIDSSHEIGELAERIIRVMGRYGYAVTPPN